MKIITEQKKNRNESLTIVEEKIIVVCKSVNRKKTILNSHIEIEICFLSIINSVFVFRLAIEEKTIWIWI